MISRPTQNEYAEYYNYYIGLVPEGDILDMLEDQLDVLKLLFQDIDDEKAIFRYAEGKWSIKEVLGHLIDSERIFGYRALTFSRKDKNELPGYDHDSYIQNSVYNEIPLDSLLQELTALRIANLILFEGFTEEMLNMKGIANKNEVSVKAIVYIVAGHFIHHVKTIKEKYL